MITDPAAIPIRALIPDHHAALRTGRAMSMPRLERRSLRGTGLGPSASGTGRAGGTAACESAASIKLGPPALLSDISRADRRSCRNYRHPQRLIGLTDLPLATCISARA